MRCHRGDDGEGGIDRAEPVGLDAAVQRMPGEIQNDDPDDGIEQRPRDEGATAFRRNGIKTHRAEDGPHRYDESEQTTDVGKRKTHEHNAHHGRGGQRPQRNGLR